MHTNDRLETRSLSPPIPQLKRGEGRVRSPLSFSQRSHETRRTFVENVANTIKSRIDVDHKSFLNNIEQRERKCEPTICRFRYRFDDDANPYVQNILHVARRTVKSSATAIPLQLDPSWQRLITLQWAMTACSARYSSCQL